MKQIIPRSIEVLEDIYGLRFLVRTAYDVPILNDVVQNDYRILASIPTIQYLIERGARVIILTHVGRDAKNSTLPILAILQKYVPATYVNAVVGENAFAAVTHMKEGTVLLLENLRSCEGEVKNDESFAQELASFGNFYVNEAFAVSHRAHASIVTLPTLLPNFAGFSFLQEQSELLKMLNPEHPSLFILGGVKFETKEPLVEKYAQHYTNVFVGGALANDFLKGKGFEVGTSLLSKIDLGTSPLLNNQNILLPIDVVVSGKDGRHEAPADAVLSDEKILDAGSKTIEMLTPYIKNAKTILWNGPLGSYDTGYNDATMACAKLIAESDAYSVVGGGDTVAAIQTLNLEYSFDFLSTAGGAMLEFLEHQTLQGIDVLTDSQSLP